MSENLTAAVSDYCVAAGSVGLPADIEVRAKWVVLDEIGCTILGRTMLPGRLIRRHVQGLAGAGNSTIVGSGKIPNACSIRS